MAETQTAVRQLVSPELTMREIEAELTLQGGTLASLNQRIRRSEGLDSSLILTHDNFMVRLDYLLDKFIELHNDTTEEQQAA